MSVADKGAPTVYARPAARGPRIFSADRIAPLAYFAALMLAWEAVIRVFEIPGYIFPPPSGVALAMWEGLTGGGYLYDLAVTMTEVLIGFAIGSAIGLLLGIAMALMPAFDRIVYPYVVAIQIVPKVAVAPLMIIWFGFGIHSKIVIVVVSCMFPVLINTITGMRNADSDRIALIKAMCGTPMQILRYVQLPSALPYIFAGLNTGIILAVIGAIVGEFVGARSGIGVLILKANFALDLASVFALLTLLSVAGVVLNLLVRYLERRWCFWGGKATK